MKFEYAIATLEDKINELFKASPLLVKSWAYQKKEELESAIQLLKEHEDDVRR